MTPDAIRSQRFGTRLLWGLRPEEVSAFLEDVAEAYGDVQKRNASLRARVEGLEDEIVVLVRFVVMEPSGLEKGVLREMLTEIMPEKAERVLSIAEQWVAEGQATIILRLMSRRFGPLPDAFRQKVMAGSLEELDAWADALLDAKTLDEVLAAAPSINS